MDRNNKNNSGVFGGNGNVNELRNISSSDWAPISAGRTAGEKIKPPVKPSSQKKAPTAEEKKKATAKGGKKGKSSVASSDKNKKEADRLISAGRPDDNKKAGSQSQTGKAKKNTSGQTQTQRSSQQKKQAPQKPASRTPKGRDMRKDAREERAYNEELSRNRDEVREQLGKQRSLDEIAHVQNKSKQKLILKKSVASALKFGAVAILLIIICVYNFGAITRTVIINGENPYTNEQIQQAAGVRTGRSMFYLSEKRIYRKLTKNLPYIKDVTLERDIPDTVILTVTQTTARYIVTLQGKWITLDSDGKIVSDTDTTVPDGLFRMEGFDAQVCAAGDTFVPEGVNAERYALMQQLVPILEKYKILNKSVVNLQNMQDITITVDGKYRAYMGDCEYDLEHKIKYLSKILKQAKSIGKSGYVNLRYDVGYFKPGSMEMR